MRKDRPLKGGTTHLYDHQLRLRETFKREDRPIRGGTTDPYRQNVTHELPVSPAQDSPPTLFLRSVTDMRPFQVL